MNYFLKYDPKETGCIFIGSRYILDTKKVFLFCFVLFHVVFCLLYEKRRKDDVIKKAVVERMHKSTEGTIVGTCN